MNRLHAAIHFGGSPLQEGSVLPWMGWAAGPEQRDAWWGGAWASKLPEKRSTKPRK